MTTSDVQVDRDDLIRLLKVITKMIENDRGDYGFDGRYMAELDMLEGLVKKVARRSRILTEVRQR